MVLTNHSFINNCRDYMIKGAMAVVFSNMDKQGSDICTISLDHIIYDSTDKA